jgi:hypothetical protein
MSAARHPANPAWYHNVLASPHVMVEAGTETFAAIVTIAAGAERAALYQRCVAAYPQLADYQARRAREVPIVVITPARRLASAIPVGVSWGFAACRPMIGPCGSDRVVGVPGT